MSRQVPLVAALMLGWAGMAHAQVRLPRMPVIFPLGQGQPQPPAPGAVAGAPVSLQQDLFAKVGTDTVYFSPRGYNLDAAAIATLTAQARWLLANPFVRIRLEGHGDSRDSRDYAIAIGDRRANAVRDFLILQGVAPARISVISWGKERPGTVRVGAQVVGAGPRVVTIVE